MARILTPGNSVTWVTDQRCTLIVNEDLNLVFQLTGIDEVLWDCLIQGVSYNKIIQMVSEMRNYSTEAAVIRVEATFLEWCNLGLVQEEANG